MSDSAGIVGGRYRLVRTIGRGGMGTVWQAHDEVLGRDVAVKEVLPPSDLSGPERDVFTVRTFREARTAGRVAHPGVATVYDVVEEHGHPWIVMQLVRSRTLGELVRDDGPMRPVEAARIGLQLLEALRAAHAAGVLHRDVKPDNVLLTEDGRAVLTDFGIATTEDEAPVTRTGILIGTPAFMAPERAAGGAAEAASDLWSLGVTLYVAVEGHSPFHRANALATLGAVMHAEPAPLSRAGVLAPVLLGLLRKNPAERMTAQEAGQRLAAIIRGLGPEPTGPVPLPEVTGSGGTEAEIAPAAVRAASARRRQPLLALGVGALVTALVTGGASWWSHRPVESTSPPARPPAVVHTPEKTAKVSDPPAKKGSERGGDPADPPARSGLRRDSTPPATYQAVQRGRETPPGRRPAERDDRGKPTKKKDSPSAEPKRPADRKPTGRPDGDAPGQVEPSNNGGGAQAHHHRPGRK
ncbi:protein kinase [Nonomuraea sp. MCN248]|uniref:non-specific serine/threonine protein kinase n=1 Tax=Nonomuraea corallina TaxID=2989783 RepID=A0ABT4SE18_9ACTN|nr:serine/threonine-protein kinase [Nonomuraea corallina]MDA0635186.1 protein kinase [Nonomuraea corallina]